MRRCKADFYVATLEDRVRKLDRLLNDVVEAERIFQTASDAYVHAPFEEEAEREAYRVSREAFEKAFDARYRLFAYVGKLRLKALAEPQALRHS